MVAWAVGSGGGQMVKHRPPLVTELFHYFIHTWADYRCARTLMQSFAYVYACVCTLRAQKASAMRQLLSVVHKF